MKSLNSRSGSGKKTARPVQVKLGQRFRLLGVLTALLTAVVLLLVAQASAKPEIANAQAPIVEAQDLVHDAWERAQASGRYRFTADVLQTTNPVVNALNAGRQGRQQSLYLEGETNLPDQQLTMSLWTQAGSVRDDETAVQVRVDGDKAFTRQGDQPWEAADDFTDLFAPNSDFMTYLVAAQNIRDIGSESRAGIDFTRYAFELDGPSYAAYLRDQMQAQMQANGELPYGMSLSLPEQYVDMIGSGELWITADGWPLRQIITLQFPPQNESQVNADITVNFSNFDKTAVASLPATPTAKLTHQLSQLQTIDPIKSLISLSSIAMVVAFLWLIVAALRSRKLRIVLNLTLIIAMLSGPWIRDVDAQQFIDHQIAQEQKEQGQQTDMANEITLAANESTATAQENFAALNADDGTDTDHDGYTDVEESLLGTNPVSTPLFIENQQQLAQIPPNDATDTDGDGLTDYEEYLVNTQFDNDDTDNDGIPDGAEVIGFTLGSSSQKWYTNPHLADSNGDGLSDTDEWGDLDASNRPDTDGDGVPDLFDPDNDDDGVPDQVDISPYVHNANPTTYTDDDPLNLIINNLTPGELTYVELQLRPTNPDHLWYAFNVLDWPLGDRQASMQDDDGLTFADIDGSLTAKPHENGDIKLIPILEITVPQENNNLPDDTTLEQYNIDPADLPDATDGKIVYAPLQIVTEPDTGEQAAFYAKIPYLPGEEWGDAHQVRLIWVVQALVDVCDSYWPTGECRTYSEHNKISILQSYPDDWQLTGLTVRENIESKITTIYEDPSQDTNLDNSNPNVDNPTWALMMSLDEYFLGAYEATKGVRDVTLDSIYDRFDHATTTSSAADRWDLDNVYTVVKNSYEHVDIALFTQAKETNSQILSTAFGGATNAKPTLVVAREDTYRSLNLNEIRGDLSTLFVEEGNQFTIDMDPTKIDVAVMASLKWTPYTYANGSWQEMGMEPYWNILAQRHQAEFVQNVGAENAEGGIFALQMIYMSYYTGLVSVVELNGVVLSKNFSTGDAPLGAQLGKLGRVVATAGAEYVVDNILATGSYKYFVDLRDGQVGFTAIKEVVLTSRTNLAVFASVAVVTITLIVLRGLFPDELGVRIATAVVVGLLGTLWLVIKPILTVIVLAENFQHAYQLKGLSEGLRAVANNTDDIMRGTRASAIAGLVVSVIIGLGIFMWATETRGISAGTPAYNQLVSQFAASLLVAVITFVLSLSLVGTVVLGIVTVIDLFLLALGSDFSITGALTEALADAIYDFKVMVKSPDIATSNLQLDFIGDGAEIGLIEGNPIQLSLTISTTITHTTGTDLIWSSNFTRKNLRSTTISHTLDSLPIEYELNRRTMSDAWTVGDPLGESYRFSGYTVQTASIALTPTAGVNTSTPVYLNSHFALPGIDCAYAFFRVSPNCDTHTLRGNSSTNVGSGMVLDVFPATLDEFYALEWGDSRPFPQQRDHDGDGLIADSFGGSDPNDSLTDCEGGVCWDKDRDGLSDRKEVELQLAQNRNSPFTADVDGDGVCDPEELRLGTDPQNRDTDGDGLWDGVETWHYSCIYNDWRGGWAFTAGSLSILMVSDPLTVDADGDGLSDKSERDLYNSATVDSDGVPYHPNIPNDNPLGLTIEFSQDVVGQNDPLVVTTTVHNKTPAWVYGTVTTTVPVLASGGNPLVVAETFPNLDIDLPYPQTIDLTVPNNATSGAYIFTAKATAGQNNGSIEPTWAWLNSPPPPPISTTAYRVAVTDMPAAIANQQNKPTLSAATLESLGANTLDVSPLLSANGFNRPIVGNGGYGNPKELNPQTTSEYNSDLTANTPPDVVCNDAGDCLTVASSAYWFNCKTASFVSIHAIKQNDRSGGSEFYIHKNGRDWNADFSQANGIPVWTNIPEMNNNTTRYPNEGTAVSFQWCEGDTIDLWENDGTGVKEDDQYCTFRYTNANSPDLEITNLGYLKWTCQPNDNNHIEITVKFEDTTSPKWQGDYFQFHNCATINIDDLIVYQSADRGTIGGNSEYYIQLNGTNRGGNGNNNGEGTTIWDGIGSVANVIGNPPVEVAVNTTIRACRGDTIDIWEDDGNDKDDFICSIYVLGHDGANPTIDPAKSTQTNTYLTLPDLGWIQDGGICRTPDNNTQLDLRLRAQPNPRYRMTAGLYNAGGIAIANGILLSEQQTITASDPKAYTYRQLSNPAVASDGSNFVAYWIVGNGDLQYRKVNANGTLPRASFNIISPNLGNLQDVDVVWVGGKYLVTIQNANADIYVFYTNNNGDLLTNPKPVVGGSNAQVSPDLAVNPATGDAMLTYRELPPNSTNGIIYAQLIKNGGSTPNIGSPTAVETTVGAALAEVAYMAEHNLWIVSISKNGVTTRALNSDGTLFSKITPDPNVIGGINSAFSLACDQQLVNAFCTLASISSGNLASNSFQVIKTPLNLNDFSQVTARTLIIDTQAPTTTLSLPDDHVFSLKGPSINLMGQAKDDISNIVSIKIRFNSTNINDFVAVTDGPDENTPKEAWTHSWTPTNLTIPYTIDVQLIDSVGNSRIESFTNVRVDGVLPTLTSGSAQDALLPVSQDSDGNWIVALGGTVSDDRGVTAVVVPTQQGDKSATLSACNGDNTSCNWNVDYPLPTFDASGGLSGPASTYIANVQAYDDSDKVTELDIQFRVDGAAPIAQLLVPDPLSATRIISGTTLTVSGVITDPGNVATGVQSLQIALVETGANTLPDWNTAVNATLDTPDAVSTAWNYTLPTDIEGNYQIYLRGTDTNQNDNDLPGTWFTGWQGIIDTQPPVASVTITPVGRGNSLKYDISATVTDSFLSEAGWDFVCDSTDGTRATVSDPLSDGETFNERLIELNVSCQVNGKNLPDPLVLTVSDLFGNQTTVTTALPTGNNLAQSSLAQPALATASMAQTSEAQASLALASVVASTILTPTNNSVLTTYDPVTITGAAYADDLLDELSLTINATEVYTESWASQAVTDTVWTTTWTPTADGVYEFVTVATDQNSVTQTVLQPVTIIVDTQAPTVTLDNTVFTETHKLADELVALTGTLSEERAVESVMVSINGAPAERADFDTTSWRYVWVVDVADDGTTFSVDITVSDGGNVTTINETVTVDILEPDEVVPTMSMTDGNTPVIITNGGTARDPQTTTLQLDWTPSNDGSGIDHYQAQWTQSISPTISSMTMYPANGTLSHQETGTEATAWFAHLQTVDGLGNSTLQTEGPIYIDAPTTPDYINPADGLTTTIYRGWMDSGCSQIGANYEIFRNRIDGTSLTAVQEMYLTWDAANLRMAWVGANWNVDGDLFIYLDTGSGGATDAYDPFNAAHTITLPAQGSNQLAANYVIHIIDGNTAELRAWNGSSWDAPQLLGTPNYFYNEGTTDLYLPLSMIGNPTTMKMVAYATDEQALRLWAAMPSTNPLNSALVANDLALPFLDQSFSLQQQYEWTTIGQSGVCPAAGQFENADLNVSITASVTGSQVGYQAFDMPSLLQSGGVPKAQLDSNNNGVADLDEDNNSDTYLPLDTQPSAIGPGGIVSYTLRVTNDGDAPATGVQVDLAAFGAMALHNSPAQATLGTIAPNSFVEHTFEVQVGSSTTIDGGEVTAVISDATHGAFDWLWILYDIDHEGPTDVTILGPKYINSDLNQIFGTLLDASDVPTIILQEHTTGSRTATCTDATPADGSWICTWDATGVTAANMLVYAKGIDEWGNAGGFGDTFEFILDDVPPTITLDAASTTALGDNLLLTGELLMQGTVTDDNAADFAELCAQEASATEPTCVEIDVNPNTGHWVGTLPNSASADNDSYTFTFTGVDVAGNRSTTITYSNILVDTTGPEIDVTTFVQSPSQFANITVVAGTVTDGAGITEMSLWISKLDGSESLFFNNILSGNSWSYSRAFSELGQYSISLKAIDGNGNITTVGPLVLTVVEATVNLPPTINIGAGFTVNEGSSVVLEANASDPNGDSLTIEWDLDNNGSYETAGATATFDATGIDATATPQAFTVNVRVSDGVNSPVVASTIVSVVNASPVLSNLVATAVIENGTTTLTGNISDPAIADSFTLDVNWGDGSSTQTVSLAAGATSFSLTHQYLDDNPSSTQLDNVPISLTITDDDGGVGQGSTTVAVSNSAPTVSNVTATAIDENGTTTLSGTIVDVGTLDSFTLEVDWGDGSGLEIFDYAVGATSFSETHQYLDDNPSGTAVDNITIDLTIKDDDLSENDSTTTVTVSNLAPTLSNIAITDVDENGVATLTGNLADMGTEDSFTLDVDWGDGSTPSSYSYPAGTAVFTETHQFLDDNPSATASDPYTVNLTLTDDDTGIDVDSVVVTISNLSPVLSNIAITDVNEDGVATLTGNLADVGTEDSFTLDVDWGDGSTPSTYSYPAGTAVFTETHQFLDDNPTNSPADEYTVNLTLTDDDTGQTTDSVNVTVSNVAPILSNIAITDVNEDGVSTLTGNLADIGTQDSFTLEVDWGDGSTLSTYSYPAGTAVFTETHQYIDDNPTNTAVDNYTVNLILTDDDLGFDTDSVIVTVSNVDPVLSNIAITDVNEDGVATLTGNLTDMGSEDSFTLDVDWGDGSTPSTYSYPAGTAVFTETHRYLDDNPSGTAADPYTVNLTLTDDDTGFDTDSVVVTVTNVAPVLETDVPTQTVQYSDGIGDITITGTDVADDPLVASTSWSLDGGAFTAGLPDGMSLTTNICLFSGNARSCSWTLSGITDVIAGLYTIRVTVEDNDLGVTSIDQTIEIIPEDATLTIDPDNPVAVQVDAPGSNASEPFSLSVTVEELEPDLAAYLAAAGDINLAELSITLEPVGPGSPVTGTCTPTLVDPVLGYDDVLTVTCTFDDVPVNTYSVAFLVDGGYYSGYSEDVLVIYDPSLGFTTGGGWFYWPGSEDLNNGYPGDRTNFGYTMKYNKPLTSIQGNLLLIRHLPDGSIYRFKSNAIEGLSLGDVGAFGWASFTGKGTYLEPGWPDPIGNHQFIFYVEDHDEPGTGIDRVWVETRDKDDLVIPVMSMPRPGSANAVEINGGNIVVPHTGGTNNQPPTADFSFAVDGLTVSFTDQSSDQGGQVVNWQWNFGDGSSDTIQNPTHNYATAGIYDATLTVTDNDDETNTVTYQVTVSTGSVATEMYIGDLTSTSTPSGNKWNALVTIQVLDDLGNPVANAQVSGSWSNGTSGSDSCVTNGSGICTITKTNINGNRDSVTFTVDNVTHAALTYNASLNVDSLIVVPKP